MSFSDIATRIGSIQGTLARVSGTPETATSQSSGSTTTASSTSSLASSTGLLGSTSASLAGMPAAFTQALQDAMATPGTTGSTATAPTDTAVSKAAAAGNQPPATSTGVDGSDVVQTAQKYLGIPYVWGGNNPKIGLDCSSFVQHTFRDLGVDLPRVARQQATQGTEVPSLAQAKPGDLIVTRGGGHIGIYLGDNKMIHAPRPGENVSIRKLFETDADIMTIRRIVPSTSAAVATPASAVQSSANAAAQQMELTAAAQRTMFSTAVNGA